MDDIGVSLKDYILNENVSMIKGNGIRPGKLKNGYVPVMVYIKTEGCLVNDELREGKQHCPCNTPRFLKETIALCRELTDAPCLFVWIPARILLITLEFFLMQDVILLSNVISAEKGKATGVKSDIRNPLTLLAHNLIAAIAACQKGLAPLLTHPS